jgi:hypothetical protein
MKTLVVGVGALLLVALARPAAAQQFGLTIPYAGPYGGPYMAPAYPPPGYGGYPLYPYYPYPLPPAPSLGFGRGGIYGHGFVGRDEGITGFTLPGWR